ncbi:rhomboid family intramembrane serine protease [Flavihumibacter fluvii]|uniref:rhomboid family intramembrane serine protease n=1 Tax=Flavihumibacter fluvii TaxID=2838157 RepID=UPI001BDEF89D|nr:rhomboid family intramembrane serine protease [Flavihumibacter fluvii]ULQ51429.1 rhomboid family intramembrane serine protease [Flavihumibacter fluvii]
MRALPPIVKNLLIANVLIYLAQLYFARTETPLELYGALWPLASGNFKIWQLVTHMFMHGSWFHIFFNMFTLYMFGAQLEQVWGSKRFFNFYMICGIVAGVAQLFLGGDNGYAVGASGAIMGVLAAFTYLFPNTPLYLMFIPIPIKAKYAIPGLMALDLFGGISNTAGDNIAHWAHLGGAAAGFILVLLWNKTNRNTFY